MKYVILLLLVVVFSFFFLPSQASAFSNFSIGNDAVYTILDSGETEVNYKMALTNTTSQFYASKYSLDLAFSDIRNLIVSDAYGPIKPILKKTGFGHTIEIPFLRKSVGAGTVLPFTITFTTRDVVLKNGEITEITVPGIIKQDDFSYFTVNVVLPKAYPKPSYIKPKPKTDNYIFTKGELGKGGVLMAFGNTQYYSFSVIYKLKNYHIFPAKKEIVLPSSNEYQTIIIDEINQKPKNVTYDNDGNWIAHYYLLPKEEKEVIIKGRVKISLQTTKKTFLAPKEHLLYTASRLYWDSQNSKIQSLAKQLKTPEAIYQYVVKTLKYDQTRIAKKQKRVGAFDLLSNPNSSLCLEFTDLFIAMARAAGIPARAVVGYVYRADNTHPAFSENLLHTWAQYYDGKKNIWLMVDPTWGNTTGGLDYFTELDFDHFTLGILGEKSTAPQSLDLLGNTAQHVFLKPIPSFEIYKPNLSLRDKSESNVLAGFPMTNVVRINNVGKTNAPEGKVTVSSEILLPHTQQLYYPPIPPYGYVDIPMRFKSTDILTNKTAVITIQGQNYSSEQFVHIIPIFDALNSSQGILMIVIGGIAIASISITLFIITKRARRIPVS